MLENMTSQEQISLCWGTYSPTSIANKAISPLSEQFTQKNISTRSLQHLNSMERAWVDSLSISFSETPAALSRPPWNLQLNIREFDNWIKAINSHSLFFDGALKRNSREADAGGVFLIPGGHMGLSYAWSLDHATNNQAEAYVLLKVLNLAKDRGISPLTVIKDSSTHYIISGA
jgi:hypothetical protein